MSRNLRELIHDGFMAAAPKALLRRMNSCERIVPRVSFPESQTVAQRMETAFHLGICQACWDYRKQLSILDRSYRKVLSERSQAVSGSALEMRIHELSRRFSKR